MEWVASTLHTTSERGVSSITTADEHTSAASSRLNWRPQPIKMDSSVSPKGEVWFLLMCLHISNSLPPATTAPSLLHQCQSLHITTWMNNRSTVQLKCDGTWWRTWGEVKGKLANAVGSQYSSHNFGTWRIQHYYSWCAHLGCQQSTELTPPHRLKWTCPLRRKTKSGFCVCAITFQTQSTTCYYSTFPASPVSVSEMSSSS